MGTRVSRRGVLVVAAAMMFAIAGTATPAMAKAKAKANAKANAKAPATMLPLRITDVVVRDGQLVALGTLGSNRFEAPLVLSPGGPAANDPACEILNLEVGAISLDLLGLQVDTSDICLRVEGQPGPGNLLGNLLCGVAGLLDDGLNLGDILDNLTDAQLTNLLTGIRDLLNGVLGRITAPTAVAGVSSSAEVAAAAAGGNNGGGNNGGHQDCDVLNLSLGPVDLNLLGLDVELDNCEDGPVTVDVTAERGAGKLLGNLLCNLAGLLDRPANANAIANSLNRVADAILRLVG